MTQQQTVNNEQHSNILQRHDSTVPIVCMYLADLIKMLLESFIHTALMNDEQRNTTHLVYLYGILHVKKKVYIYLQNIYNNTGAV